MHHTERFPLSGLLTLLLALASTFAHAQTFPGSDLGVIPPGGLDALNGPEAYASTRDVVFDVSGLDGTVATVSVEFSAAHTWVGDLRVTLISPIGVPHIVFSRTGATTAGSVGDGSDLVAGSTYRFSDTATINWWNHVAAAGAEIPAVTARTTVEGGAGVSSPAPATSLNDAFRTTPPNGRWILRFEDGFDGDEGEVVSASLELTTQGTTRVVNTNNPNFADSLEQILPIAQAGDLITFGPFFDLPQTLQLLGPLPVITQPIAIQGPGAHLLTIRRLDNAPEFRIFDIAAAGQVSISGLGISNGSVADFGGGLSATSPLVLSGVHAFGNLADNGGGASIGGTRSLIIDSTFSGNRTRFQSAGVSIINPIPGSRMIGATVSDNHAGSWPAGVYVVNFGAAPADFEILNSTIVNNRADGFIGGIRAEASGGGDMTLRLRNSIVSDNLPLNFNAGSISGTATIQSLGFNLSSSYDGAVVTVPEDQTGETRLGPLALYGGSVPTHPPRAGSPAIDNGKAFRGGPRGGARGEPRLFDDPTIANPGVSNGADIGAVEMQSIYVATDSDSGAGSLRQAISNANDNGPGLDDIQFDAAFFATPRSIDLATALPTVSSASSIHGPGARLLSVQRDSGEEFRIFTIAGGLSHVAVSRLAVRGGRAGFGGGIQAFSPFSLIESIVEGNASTFGSGGGIDVRHNGWIDRSSIIGNASQEDGGGVAKFVGNADAENTVLRISQSTISGNTANLRGGGVASLIFQGRGDIEIERSTIAENQAAVEHDAVAALIINGSFTFIFLRGSILSGRADTPVVGTQAFASGTAIMASRGFNLFTDDFSTGGSQSTDLLNSNAGLGPLTTLGSPTPIHPLFPGSDAIDAGSSQGRLSGSDQRGAGFRRLVDLGEANTAQSDGTDIGAYEAQVEPQGDTVFDDRFEAL